MALPPMIAALGWERLRAPRIGVINLVLRARLEAWVGKAYALSIEAHTPQVNR